MNHKEYHAVFKKAILIRQFETRLLKLFAEGKINGTVHTCVGEELNAVMLCRYVNDNDMFISNHRGHGHFIAKTGKVYELMAEMMGKTSGVSCGYGGSQHLFTEGFISNGVQGGMTPIAAGIALSYKLSNKQNIAVSFIGDGTLGEGLVYESFNISSMWHLPILYVLENNHYAQSTSNKQTLMGCVKKRAEGFGMSYYKTNVWDMDDMDAVINNAVVNARAGKPTLLEIDCYRLNSHSKGDDNRNPEEVAYYKEKDLINSFSRKNTQLYEQFKQEADEMLDTIVLKASEDNTLTEVPNRSLVVDNDCSFIDYENDCSVRGAESIHKALLDFFQNNRNAVLLGEDVINQSPYTGIPYGGAFKVTKELSDLFPERVLNTPISEQAIVGVGIGLALMGYKSLSEIMFGDFMTLTLDQLLQHASKFCEMYGRPLVLPFILRTPMGGRRGYGPTHSQSIEKFFMGIPNVNILAINNCVEPKEIYQTLFDTIKTPTIVIENKVLYTHIGFKRSKGFRLQKTNEAFPTIKYRPDSKTTDITIVCYGGLSEIVRDVVEQLAMEDIICEMLSPTSIVPLNIFPIAKSVELSEKLIIVEEGPNFAALGSEILAALLERNVYIKRVSRIGNNGIIPCSLPGENNLLPNKELIISTIKSIL